MRKISDRERLIREINKTKDLQATLNKIIADIEYMSMMTDVDLSIEEEVEDNE